MIEQFVRTARKVKSKSQSPSRAIGEKKLMGIILAGELNFKMHIIALCNKANQNLHAKSRVSSCMGTNQG